MYNLTINKMKKNKKICLIDRVNYEVVTRSEKYGLECVVAIYNEYAPAREYAEDLFVYHKGTPLEDEVVFVRCVTVKTQVMLQLKTLRYECNKDKCISARPSKRRKG